MRLPCCTASPIAVAVSIPSGHVRNAIRHESASPAPATLAALTGTLTNGDASGFAPYVVGLKAATASTIEIKISAGTVA